MKEVKEVTKSTHTRYEAYDGIRFADKDECLTYEQSAKGTLLSMLNDSLVNQDNEYEWFDGSDEIQCKLFNIKDERQWMYLVQLDKLFHPEMELEKPKFPALMLVKYCPYSLNWINIHNFSKCIESITNGEYTITKTEKSNPKNIDNIDDMSYDSSIQ
jgi:hypothetical protein